MKKKSGDREKTNKEKTPIQQLEESHYISKFGRSELQLLNLIAEIIVEITMQDDENRNNKQ